MSPRCIFFFMMPRQFQKSIGYGTIRTETHKCESMAPKNHRRLTVDLPDELFVRLKSLCVLKNLSMRVVVTRLIYHEIRRQEERESPAADKDAQSDAQEF